MISVVDDDPSVRKALSRLIKSCGHDAAEYESAEAFLAADVVGDTECLVLDVHLPGMSGLDLQADGGTHVNNTSEVGELKVADYKSKGKINKRIYIELG